MELTSSNAKQGIRVREINCLSDRGEGTLIGWKSDGQRSGDTSGGLNSDGFCRIDFDTSDPWNVPMSSCQLLQPTASPPQASSPQATFSLDDDDLLERMQQQAQPLFQWQSDDGWVDYASSEQDVLRQAWDSGSDKSCLLDVGGAQYFVNLESMDQLNLETDFDRKIRVKPATGKGSGANHSAIAQVDSSLAWFADGEDGTAEDTVQRTMVTQVSDMTGRDEGTCNSVLQAVDWDPTTAVEVLLSMPVQAAVQHAALPPPPPAAPAAAPAVPFAAAPPLPPPQHAVPVQMPQLAVPLGAAATATGPREGSTGSSPSESMSARDAMRNARLARFNVGTTGPEGGVIQSSWRLGEGGGPPPAPLAPVAPPNTGATSNNRAVGSQQDGGAYTAITLSAKSNSDNYASCDGTYIKGGVMLNGKPVYTCAKKGRFIGWSGKKWVVTSTTYYGQIMSGEIASPFGGYHASTITPSLLHESTWAKYDLSSETPTLAPPLAPTQAPPLAPTLVPAIGGFSLGTVQQAVVQQAVPAPAPAQSPQSEAQSEAQSALPSLPAEATEGLDPSQVTTLRQVSRVDNLWYNLWYNLWWIYSGTVYGIICGGYTLMYEMSLYCCDLLLPVTEPNAISY
jgi:hypothetical protein